MVPIVSELDIILESGYYESPLGYNIVDWFVEEVIKLEKKIFFYFENTNKNLLMSGEEEELYTNESFF